MSWAFALNWFHSQGLPHGRGLQAGSFCCGSKLGCVRQESAPMAFGDFCVAAYAGSRLFHIFGYAGFDFFLSWLVLLLLGCTIAARRW